jgi:thiamine-phosphate pyrophosphorylase
MLCRQSFPGQWFILRDELDWRALRKLPRGSGLLILRDISSTERRRLRALSASRDLLVIRGADSAERIHNIRELTRAKLRAARFILISPIHRTRSHPEWEPLPRMRAAALARLSGRRAIALGGMDARRFERVQPLGFVGWAGISAWLQVQN